MNPLLEQFLQEARENLAFIDQNIENIPNGDKELLNSVFRAAHTLKGGSGIVGFEGVKVITHHAEDLLDQLRAGKLAFNADIEAGLYDAFDEVVNLIEAAEESEDVVEADETRTAMIVERLNGLMGKSQEVAAWNNPMVALPESMSVANEDLPFLATCSKPIPFVMADVTEDNFNEERLYGVFLDLDENCMLFGNDPIYALSLLGDKVLYLSTCLSAENAHKVLDGSSEDELLAYRTTIIAYIYASYEDIEEALYNFIDDLLFKPLDMVSLLTISRGEIATLDVIKDFSEHAVEKLLKNDIDGLKSSIVETLSLIGAQTLQSRRLKRLLDLVDQIDVSNYSSLKSFLEGINSQEAFVYKVGSESDTSGPTVTEVTEEATVEVKEDVSKSSETELTEFSEDDKKMLFTMLEQQLLQLRKNNDESTKIRVENLVRNPIQSMGYNFEASYSSCESLIEAIEAVVGVTSVKTTTVETPKVVEKAPEVKAVPKAEEKPKVAEAAKPIETVSPKTVEPVLATPAPIETAEAEVVEKTVAAKAVIGKTVKIDQESIDHLMNLVGELLVAKNSLPYLADNVTDMDTEMIKRSILEKYSSINRLSMQLQDVIMGMRMLPISYVFDRYPKLVRDISKDMGKKVRLTMEGGETKLDKNIIEMMADPMIHIMRNSLDHGIELPDDRKAKNKAEEGSVHLKAYAQSDKIIIEIKDDGAGINVDKVIHKVIEKGLLTIEAIDKMSDIEKAELVLLPGLSTADTISEYSGRGVGMDVVKKSIEGFGGTINIMTQQGRGTTIKLAIPVSLAVTSLLHVSLGGVHYGFPMESVSETVKIEKEEVAILHNEPFVYLRGDVIPLLYIKQMLDFDDLEGKPLSLVVLNIKGNMLAVVVNELLGQLDVVQKPLEGVIDSHPIFSGTALLGNGQIIMVIDQDGLLGMSHTLKEDQIEAS